MKKCLIICPTHDHADALFASLSSVRAQVYTEWRLVVICDGAPERTRAILDVFAALDSRITYVWHPKGPGYGERYRHDIIADAREELVFHLGDDDVWGQHHLAKMVSQLADFDFTNCSELNLLSNGQFVWSLYSGITNDLRRDDNTSNRCLFGLNNVGYRRASYMRLSRGWEVPPTGGPSDGHMWSAFLEDADISISSSAEAQWIKLPGSVARKSHAPERRLGEALHVLSQINMPGYLEACRESAKLGAVFLRLVMAHKAGDCSGFEEALERCGLVCAQEDEPRVAGHLSAPMAVPFTEEQEEEARFYQRLLRMIDVPSQSNEAAGLHKWHLHRAYLTQALDFLGRRDVERYKTLVAILMRVNAAPSITMRSQVSVALHFNDMDLAKERLTEAMVVCPDDPWIEGFQKRIKRIDP